jgi:hypothetical protein
MTIELYAAPTSEVDGLVDSPISNITGTLPEQEPALDVNDLLGTFDSREEAIRFVRDQAEANHQVVTDCRTVPFNVYTHIEWLTIELQNDQPLTYYLVSDEGY